MEDESCQIALGNLRSEVVTLRNEALEKDKILLSLVDRLKSNEAKLDAQSEAHKAEVEDLRKKLAKMSKKFEVAKARQEISEWTSSRLQKNVEELRESKERCCQYLETGVPLVTRYQCCASGEVSGCAAYNSPPRNISRLGVATWPRERTCSRYTQWVRTCYVESTGPRT